jgi:hypothetical protein
MTSVRVGPEVKSIFRNLSLGLLLLSAGALAPAVAEANGEAALFARLMARFESPGLQAVLRRSGVAEEVLGRAATHADDWRELATVLSRNPAAGEALEWRLGRVVEESGWYANGARATGRTAAARAAQRMGQAEFEALVARLSGTALDDFLFRAGTGGGLRSFAGEHGVRIAGYADARAAFGAARGATETVGVALDDAANAARIGATEGRALTAEITAAMSAGEFGAEVRYLAEELQVTDDVVRARLAANRITMRELVERARNIPRPAGVSGIRAAVMEKIRWAIADRSMSNPNFIRYVATMVGIEIVITTLSEYGARGDRFWDEIDMVAADLITFTLAEIVLTSVTHSRATSNFIHQTQRGGRLAQFGRETVNNAMVLGGTGFALGIVGNGAVELSKAIRERNDPNAPEASERLQRVVWNAFLVGSFMAVSSNLRYMAISRANSFIGRRAAAYTGQFRSAVQYGAGFILTGALAYGNSAVGAYSYVLYADWANANVSGAANLLGMTPDPVRP